MAWLKVIASSLKLQQAMESYTRDNPQNNHFILYVEYYFLQSYNNFVNYDKNHQLNPQLNPQPKLPTPVIVPYQLVKLL